MKSVAESAIEPCRRHARRALFAFLAISVAVHAAVIVVMPPLAHGPEPARAGILEVVILQPEPLPAAPPEPAPSNPLRGPEPKRAAANTLAPPQPEQQAPVLAMSEPRPMADGSFTTPSTRAVEPPAAAPVQKAQVANAAVTPPAFNAAYLRNPAPHYPVSARRSGEQGTVTLRVLVSREGLPARVDVEKSSGSTHLDAAALEAVRAWRFTPARQGIDPVESWWVVPIVFRLEGAS